MECVLIRFVVVVDMNVLRTNIIKLTLEPLIRRHIITLIEWIMIRFRMRMIDIRDYIEVH